MTGGRAYLYDPDGRHLPALDVRSVVATRLSAVVRDRTDGDLVAAELRRLIEAHRDAGSELAARLLAERHSLEDDIWLVEPIPIVAPVVEAVASEARIVPIRHDTPIGAAEART
jgi:glutamate synthase domain-containing protein 3